MESVIYSRSHTPYHASRSIQAWHFTLCFIHDMVLAFCFYLMIRLSSECIERNLCTHFSLVASELRIQAKPLDAQKRFISFKCV